ncbi:MAG: putative ABC exporter domain-containing protein [Treponema sp.]|nr:putative ABC exporter domain-containing protein [Treponema sp.]
MNALFFIIIKSFKNSIMELFKKPGKLALYIFVMAALTGTIILSIINKSEIDIYRPITIFTGILFLFISIFTALALSKGLSGGDNIFEMNDVNLLFVSPVSPRKILLYGIVRMAKTAFLAGFFIPFQAGWLSVFGINFGGVMLIFAGFILSVIVLTIVSLFIYSKTCGSDVRKKFFRCFVLSLLLPLAVFLVYQYFQIKDIYLTLEAAICSPFMKFIPVAGWTASGLTSLLTGDITGGIFFLSLNLLLGAGLTIYILLSRADYYEDVLVTTETAYEKKRAVSDGNITAASVSSRQIKVSGTGISGSGAYALFGKHVRESLRQNRFGFISLLSVFLIIGAATASSIISDLMIIMQILMWIQVFLIGTGRGLQETYSHYIYMIPESSFKKILWSNMEVMAKTLIESVLLFGISGILISANPALIVICILTYTLFSLLLLGVNYLSIRFTGADISTGILMMIYCFAVMLIIAPGITLAVATGTIIGGETGNLAGLLVLALWELGAGLGCFALSKGVLHNCDMLSVKIKK